MTVNQITPESRHIISGVSGPYAITFPYTEGSIDVFAQRTGQRKVVPASGIILTPLSSPVGGQLYIGTEFAAAHVDWDLIIIRRTFDEQGWKGQANALEKQLEEQMDRQTMSIQELRRELRKTVRGSDVQDPLPPAGNGKILWWWNGKIVTGPSTDDLTGITNLARPLDDEGAEFGREDDTKIITRPDGVYIGDFRIMHLHFGSRALFEAATIPIWVKNWTVDYGGRHLAYRRDDTGTAIVSANGVKGSPMDPATPAHWGAAQAVDETTKLHAMIDWCTANGHEINWPDNKTYVMSRYSNSGTNINVNWTCTGTCRLISTDTVPLGFGNPTGFEDDYFIRFAGTTVLTTSVAGTTAVGSRVIPVSSTTGVLAGRHIVLINTTKMIDTDHRGQNREGFQALVTRVISPTQVEVEVPLDRQITVGTTAGMIVATDSATVLTTNLVGQDVSSMRYRMRMTSGAANGQTAWIVDYDPATGKITCHNENGMFPVGITGGDTFNIEREATVLFSSAVTGSITGNLELTRPSTFNATPGDFGFRGLVLSRALNYWINGLRVSGFSEAGIRLAGCVRGAFENIVVQDANRAYDGSDGTGYGVSVHQSSYGVFKNIAGNGCRRTLDVSGTQGSSWHVVVENVTGSGSGRAYDGELFFPAGDTESSVCGSHGNAFHTRYINIEGTDIHGVLNCRGRDEVAKGVHGVGAMQYLVNLFLGGGIDLSGLTYDDRYSEIGKTTLTQNDATTHAEQRLSFVVQIDAGNWNEARPTVVRNIRAKGVRRGLFGLRGNGLIDNLHFSDYDVTVADNPVNFAKLRTVSGFTTTYGNVVDAGGVIRQHDGYVFPGAPVVQRHFQSRAAFQAERIPAWVNYWTVEHAGTILHYRRDDSGTAIVSANVVKGSPADIPSVWHWGAICDGIADDTNAIAAMHVYCNQKNRPPSYEGATALALQIDAGIVINTDVDFRGATIKALNGIVAVPDFGTMPDGIFSVYDSTTPLVTGTVAVTDANLSEGSHNPTAEFWTDPGYVYMQGASIASGPLISTRDRTGTLTYRQPFCIIKDGRTTYGLATSMAGVGSVYYRARRNSSRGWITIKGFTCDAGTWNSGPIFNVQRNQVHVSNFSLSGDTAVQSIGSVISHNDCCHQSIDDVTVPARTSYNNQGAYVSSATRCAEVEYSDIVALNGWGWQAASLVSGLYLTNSVVNRFDAHDGGFNIFVTNSTLHENGCTLGWGGGDFVIDRVTAYNCPVMQTRTDYGGYTFSGNWSITNVILDQRASAHATVLDMETNPVGCASLVVPMPKTVTIRGVTRVGTPSGATSYYICPIRHAVNAAALSAGMVPTAFENITITDVDGLKLTGGWVFRSKIALDDLSGASRVSINFSDVSATRAPTASDLAAGNHALFIPTKTQSGTPVEFAVSLSNCSNIALDVSGVASTPHVRVSGCSDVRRIKSKSGGRTIVQGSSLNTPALLSGETTTEIGGVRVGSSGFTSMIGCQILGLNGSAGYDLSNVALGTGLLWSSSLDSYVTLPGGVNQAAAMSGFRVGSW